MSELVVSCLLVSVAQYRICFGSLLELLLGLLVVRVLVRVVFDGKFSVCLLYLIGGSVLVDAQHLVVISLVCHKLLCY